MKPTIDGTKFGSITVDGRSYPLITRTVDQGGRTYDSTVVVVKGLSEICLPDSPGDCKAAVRRIKNRFDRRER